MDRQTCLALIKNNQALSFQGAALACTIVGAVDIFGFKLTESLSVLRSTSKSRRLSKQLPADIDRLKFYPCFSPRSNSLLSITGCRRDDSRNIPDDEENEIVRKPQSWEDSRIKDDTSKTTHHDDSNDNHEQMTTRLLKDDGVSIIQDSSFINTIENLMQQLMIDGLDGIDSDTSLVLLKSCKFSNIQSIEKYAPMFKQLFTFNSVDSTSPMSLDGVCLVNFTHLSFPILLICTNLSFLIM